MQKQLKRWVVLRNLVFLAIACASFPAYGGPLVYVFPCTNFEYTPPGGGIYARCFGFGNCAPDPGELFNELIMNIVSWWSCPNQSVLNEASVNGVVGGTGLLGTAQGFCLDTGLPRGNQTLQLLCSGYRFDSGPFEFANCFQGPVFGDPPPPGGGGPGPIPCLYTSPECYPGGTWNSVTCNCDPESPIIIDVVGNGFHLTDKSSGVNFDLDGDGTVTKSAWTAMGSDDSFLVLDRNTNGRIDNGTEMFGNFTPQPASDSPNGFTALAEFDRPEKGGNGDGVIDQRDAVFANLRMWKDLNHNGVSEVQELTSILVCGVARMDLDYSLSNRRDEYGNHFRYRARVYDSGESQVGRWAYDVFFAN